MHRSASRGSSRSRRSCAAAASTRSPSTTSPRSSPRSPRTRTSGRRSARRAPRSRRCLDHYGVDPNPVRDERVRLPKERKPHIPPPLAEHVERVAETVAREYVLPLLVIDECGPAGQRARDRRGRRPRRAPPRDPRPLDVREERPLPAPRAARRPVRGAARDAAAARGSRPRRAAVPRPDRRRGCGRRSRRACKATGTPHFSPHGLRRRRGSLYYKRTGSLAEVAELLGDSKRVAADHYVYALTDYREVDRTVALARAKAV